MSNFLISPTKKSLDLKHTSLQDNDFLNALEQACSLSLRSIILE